MSQRPALQNLVTIGGVDVHDRVLCVPGTAWLRVEPDKSMAALAHLAKSPGLGVEVVGTGISEDEQDRITPEIAQEVLIKLIKDPAEVAEPEEIQLWVLA
jgi:hypothetical protein